MICVICWYIYIYKQWYQYWSILEENKVLLFLDEIRLLKGNVPTRFCFPLLQNLKNIPHLFPLGSHSIRSLSDLYPISILEIPWNPNSQWIPMNSHGWPWGSQLLRVAGVHSFPVTGLFDDPFELLHLFRPEPREPSRAEPSPMWKWLQMENSGKNFFTFTRRKSETVRPCKMSTLPCYSDLYNFTQAGSQARRMTWKRLRS